MSEEHSNGRGPNGLYPYAPSKPGAIIFAALFGISALIHLVQMVKGRAWFYTAFVLGSIMMAGGYGLRFYSAQDPNELYPYVAQSLFIILPPSLYAATIYMIYGRMVIFVNAEEASVIKPTRVTKIFVIGDVLAFFMQAGGGGMMAKADKAELGKNVMLGGLFVQLLFFGFFVIIALIFYFRMRSSPARFSIPQYGRFGWPALFKLLACAAVIIIARCVFRAIEFSQGHDGYLVSHEAFMYLCDTLPMFLVQVLFHVVRADKVFGTRVGKKLDSEIIGLYERDDRM